VAVADALSPLDMGRCLVLLDPPRRGLDADTLRHICKAGPAHLLYLSCSPDILLRDLQPLLENGYRLRECRLFDMFARTAVFETLAVLERAAKKD